MILLSSRMYTLTSGKMLSLDYYSLALADFKMDFIPLQQIRQSVILHALYYQPYFLIKTEKQYLFFSIKRSTCFSVLVLLKSMNTQLSVLCISNSQHTYNTNLFCYLILMLILKCLVHYAVHITLTSSIVSTLASAPISLLVTSRWPSSAAFMRAVSSYYMLENKCRVGYCLMNALLPHQLLTSMQLHNHVQRVNKDVKNGCCRNFKAALVGTLSILMVYLIPTLLVIKCRYRSTCLSLLVFLYILNKDCILAILTIQH